MDLMRAFLGDHIAYIDRMKKGEHLMERREFFRIALDRMGHLQRDGMTVPCEVVNLSQKGVRLGVQETFSCGDVLHLEFALNEEDLIGCTVQVKYVQPPFLGAVITYISSHYQMKLAAFVDEVNTLSVTGC